MELSDIYHKDIPEHIRLCSALPEMQRLRSVGMNCGCEYTSFPLFLRLAPYSRYDHSVGCALIVWHFTGSVAQSLAALFHDVATPTFAHVVDFLHGDHLVQESTEAKTGEILRASPGLRPLLERYGLTAEDVEDHHRWSIADNDTPQLCADRLEYTLGNLVNFGFGTPDDVRRLYGDIIAAPNEDGIDELCFRTPALGAEFAAFALRCSRIYVADPDRCAMQYLAELLRDAIREGILSPGLLMTDEQTVIRTLESDPAFALRWAAFRSLSSTADKAPHYPWKRVIPAKKRYIDPYVAGKGRVSALFPALGEQLRFFTERSLLYEVSAGAAGDTPE